MAASRLFPHQRFGWWRSSRTVSAATSSAPRRSGSPIEHHESHQGVNCMLNSTPVRCARTVAHLRRAAATIAALAAAGLSWSAAAQDLRLEGIDVQALPGQRVELRLRTNGQAPEPMSFTIDDPARITVDLPNTALGMSQRRQDVNVGPLTTVLAAEANGRTRIVLNMSTMAPYETRVEGDSVYVTVGQGAGGAAASFAGQPARTQPAAAAAAGPRAISNIDFRRGPDGAGQVVVQLTDPRTTVDVRQEGGRVVGDFQGTELPPELMRRLDVTDFATPVTTVDAPRSNGNTRLVVTPSTDYEQLAYQTDNTFTLELKPPVEEEEQQVGLFDENREYTGERLTLNF